MVSDKATRVELKLNEIHTVFQSIHLDVLYLDEWSGNSIMCLLGYAHID